MSGVFMRFGKGRAGSSGDHARYITRPPATERDMDALLTRHYPEEVRDAADYGELRDQVEEYCRQQEDDELSRPRRGGGETRTHYRLVLSFEERVDTREARDLADDYLERTFPDARALAAVHQDTEHTHVHVHLQARDIDDHKLHFDRHAYERLDEQWAAVYAREYGPEKLAEHLERKAERREWRREAVRAHGRGEDLPRAPERAGHAWSREDTERWEGRHYGHDHQSRTGDDQRGLAGRGAAVGAREHPLADFARERDRAVQAVERADREAGAALQAAAARAPALERERAWEDRQSHGLGREDDEDRGR